jgi:hypothetical protein
VVTVVAWLGSPTNPYELDVLSIFPMMVFGLIVLEHVPTEMDRATVPVTCGAAMLVPEIVLYPPPFQVERMQTPGPAMVWAMSDVLDVVVKLLKSALVSSTSARQVGEPSPPGFPSKSAIAVTVTTCVYVAGTKLE